jgi:hypothetical protein
MSLHWYPITGMLLGVEWAQESQWVCLNLLIVKVIICYGPTLHL